jgi:hypothetical protein
MPPIIPAFAHVRNREPRRARPPKRGSCRHASRLLIVLAALVASCTRSAIPQALSDRDYWNLIESTSEPPGSFNLSENFVSNEPRLPENVRWLASEGGVYIGVGPEQNFSYIARVRPAMAFIVDIRRENRSLHLLYKALFELSLDRVDFVSRLFSRPRPPDLGSRSSAREIFDRYDAVAPSQEIRASNLALVREQLMNTRKLPLDAADLEWIDRALTAFYTDGPNIRFWGSRMVERDSVQPSYRQLMSSMDMTGQTRSFLASEDAFMFVKELQSRNLIVPVVGDFAGPTALRRIGGYVRSRKDVVQAFYGSNVGVYLNSVQTLAFCANLRTLPFADDAWFVERDAVRSIGAKLDTCPALDHR